MIKMCFVMKSFNSSVRLIDHSSLLYISCQECFMPSLKNRPLITAAVKTQPAREVVYQPGEYPLFSPCCVTCLLCLQLVLRKWCELIPGAEFRCFVKENKLIGEVFFLSFKPFNY